ncbi:tetratricopeptide repeat protein [Streptomyces hydrogenans]|uniref:tetratricopeptide repeat protein n=1 Tax=Streptomyces hydrogenans TaxID=1873719 RepID=UPI0035DE0921
MDAELAVLGHERVVPGHPAVLGARELLGNVLAALGRHEEAVEQLEIVTEGRIRLLGPAHPWTVSAQELLREYRTP